MFRINFREDQQAILDSEYTSNYVRVLCSKFSPDNRYFVAGSSSGVITVWKTAVLSQQHNDSQALEDRRLKLEPMVSFKAHNGPIYSLLFIAASPLVSNRTLFISAGDDNIQCWDWKQFLAVNKTISAANALAKTSSTTNASQTAATSAAAPSITTRRLSTAVTTESDVEPLFVCTPSMASSNNAASTSVSMLPETNALYYDPINGRLFSGCGDGRVYVWDITNGSHGTTLEATSDSSPQNQSAVLALNGVSSQSSSLIFVGHSDGTVRTWDIKSLQLVNTIYPFENKVVSSGSRSSKQQQDSVNAASDRYVSVIAVDDGQNWMAIGGGLGVVTLWNIATFQLAAVMPMAAPVNDVVFTADEILTAGNENQIYHWRMNGKLVTRVETSLDAVYSLSVGNQVLIASGLGCGGNVDVYFNWSHRSFSLLHP